MGWYSKFKYNNMANVLKYSINHRNVFFKVELNHRIKPWKIEWQITSSCSSLT